MTQEEALDTITECNRQFIGKTLVAVTLSADREYTRWVFEGGGYIEWANSLHRNIK